MQVENHKQFLVSEKTKNSKIAILVSEFNTEVTSKLLESALKVLKEQLSPEAYSSIVVRKVPGAFELLHATKKFLDLNEFDSIITLGAIIKGETDHYEYLSQAVCNAMGMIAASAKIPVIFGVLTTQNLELAKARAQDNHSNKGYECALAALEMLEFNHSI